MSNPNHSRRNRSRSRSWSQSRSRSRNRSPSRDYHSYSRDGSESSDDDLEPTYKGARWHRRKNRGTRDYRNMQFRERRKDIPPKENAKEDEEEDDRLQFKPQVLKRPLSSAVGEPLSFFRRGPPKVLETLDSAPKVKEDIPIRPLGAVSQVTIQVRAKRAAPKRTEGPKLDETSAEAFESWKKQKQDSKPPKKAKPAAAAATELTGTPQDKKIPVFCPELKLQGRCTKEGCRYVHEGDPDCLVLPNRSQPTNAESRKSADPFAIPDLLLEAIPLSQGQAISQEELERRAHKAKFCTYRYNGTCLLGNNCFLSHDTNNKAADDVINLCLDIIDTSVCNALTAQMYGLDPPNKAKTKTNNPTAMERRPGIAGLRDYLRAHFQSKHALQQVAVVANIPVVPELDTHDITEEELEEILSMRYKGERLDPNWSMKAKTSHVAKLMEWELEDLKAELRSFLQPFITSQRKQALQLTMLMPSILADSKDQVAMAVVSCNSRAQVVDLLTVDGIKFHGHRLRVTDALEFVRQDPADVENETGVHGYVAHFDALLQREETWWQEQALERINTWGPAVLQKEGFVLQELTLKSLSPEGLVVLEPRQKPLPICTAIAPGEFVIVSTMSVDEVTLSNKRECVVGQVHEYTAENLSVQLEGQLPTGRDKNKPLFRVDHFYNKGPHRKMRFALHRLLSTFAAQGPSLLVKHGPPSQEVGIHCLGILGPAGTKATDTLQNAFAWSIDGQRKAPLAALRQLCSFTHPAWNALRRTPGEAADVQVLESLVRYERMCSAEQQAALEHMMKQGPCLSLISGPAGSGKTVVAAMLVAQWFTHFEGNILVVSNNQAGVEDIYDHLVALGVQTSHVGVPEGKKIPERLFLQHQAKSSPSAKLSEELQTEILKLQRVLSDPQADRRSWLWAPAVERLNLLRDQMVELQGRVWRDTVATTRVVCATCLNAAHRLLTDIPFAFVLIDNASCVTEPEALIPILKGSVQVVLIGDPSRSPSLSPAKNEVTTLQRSLFHRLLAAGVEVHDFQTQYRMHPTLFNFLNQRYHAGQLMDAFECSLLRLHNGILPITDAVAVVHVEGFEDMNGPSYFNAMEACLVMILVKQLTERGVTDIAIFTPFSAQRKCLELHLRFLGLNTGLVRSFDSFFSLQTDVVIMSMVRTYPGATSSFISNTEWMKAALSRARKALVVVAHTLTIAYDELWGRWLEHHRTYLYQWDTDAGRIRKPYTNKIRQLTKRKAAARRRLAHSSGENEGAMLLEDFGDPQLPDTEKIRILQGYDVTYKLYQGSDEKPPSERTPLELTALYREIYEEMSAVDTSPWSRRWEELATEIPHDPEAVAMLYADYRRTLEKASLFDRLQSSVMPYRARLDAPLPADAIRFMKLCSLYSDKCPAPVDLSDATPPHSKDEKASRDKSHETGHDKKSSASSSAKAPKPKDTHHGHGPDDGIDTPPPPYSLMPEPEKSNGHGGQHMPHDPHQWQAEHSRGPRYHSHHFSNHDTSPAPDYHAKEYMHYQATGDTHSYGGSHHTSQMDDFDSLGPTSAYDRKRRRVV